MVQWLGCGFACVQVSSLIKFSSLLKINKVIQNKTIARANLGG